MHRQALSLGLAFLLLVFGPSGCYWLRYEKLMQTHLSLLLAMAHKMVDLLEHQTPIPPAAMAEFTYPLVRARDFARIAAQRYQNRPSLQAFSRFLDTYEALVQEVDRLRLKTASSPPLTPLKGLIHTLHQKARKINHLLEEEKGQASFFPLSSAMPVR